MVMRNKLPRNNQYELFTTKNRTYCFDDLDIAHITPSDEMFQWLRAQPKELCRPMDETNVAYYLQPKLYLMWKLRYNESICYKQNNLSI